MFELKEENTSKIKEELVRSRQKADQRVQMNRIKAREDLDSQQVEEVKRANKKMLKKLKIDRKRGLKNLPKIKRPLEA